MNIRCLFGHKWTTCIYDKTLGKWVYWCARCGVDK